MAHQQIRDEVVAAAAKHSKSSRKEVLEASSLDAIVDSMAMIGIVFELEEKYGIEIDDADILEFENIDDVVDCVFRQLDEAA